MVTSRTLAWTQSSISLVLHHVGRTPCPVMAPGNSFPEAVTGITAFLLFTQSHPLERKLRLFSTPFPSLPFLHCKTLLISTAPFPVYIFPISNSLLHFAFLPEEQNYYLIHYTALNLNTAPVWIDKH